MDEIKAAVEAVKEGSVRYPFHKAAEKNPEKFLEALGELPPNRAFFFAIESIARQVLEKKDEKLLGNVLNSLSEALQKEGDKEGISIPLLALFRKEWTWEKVIDWILENGRNEEARKLIYSGPASWVAEIRPSEIGDEGYILRLMERMVKRGIPREQPEFYDVLRYVLDHYVRTQPNNEKLREFIMRVTEDGLEHHLSREEYWWLFVELDKKGGRYLGDWWDPWAKNFLMKALKKANTEGVSLPFAVWHAPTIDSLVGMARTVHNKKDEKYLEELLGEWAQDGINVDLVRELPENLVEAVLRTRALSDEFLNLAGELVKTGLFNGRLTELVRHISEAAKHEDTQRGIIGFPVEESLEYWGSNIGRERPDLLRRINEEEVHPALLEGLREGASRK